MGRDTRSLVFSGTVSNHNSEQDGAEQALWAQFVAMLVWAASDPRFEALGIIWTER